ncbi:MAG: hypothetical protein F6J90_10205 [Moorea sp. SIOASIH]|nr:hypothetical protein [Moorena sp. SIOASIH]
MSKRVWATLVGNFPTSHLYFPSLSQVNGYLHWVTVFYSFFELSIQPTGYQLSAIDSLRYKLLA